MLTQSYNFREYKTQEYFKFVAESILKLRKAYANKSITENAAEATKDFIISAKKSVFETPETIEKHFALKDSQKIVSKSILPIQVAYGKLLDSIYNDAIDLGLRHCIYDLLYEYNEDMREFFDNQIVDLKLASFAKRNRKTDFIVQESENRSRYGLTRRAVENFLDEKRAVTPAEDTPADKKRFIRELGDSQQRLKIADEVSRNVYMLNKISTVSNFLDASKKDFLQNNYLAKRKRVLQINFSQRTDAQVRNQIGEFLRKNREFITNLKSQRQIYAADLATLKNNIQVFLERDSGTTFNAKTLDTVIRTELSIGYNFGKIGGFGGKSDRYKRFRWNVDREYAQIARARIAAEGKNQYQDIPCPDCERLDGLQFFMFEILGNGKQIGDILDYKYLKDSKTNTQTIWRNSTRPNIPYHPRCNCYWELSEDNDDDDIEKLTQKLAKERRDPKQTLENIEKVSLTIAKAGVALNLGSAIGGAILNLFKRQPAPITAYDVPRLVKTGLKKLELLRIEPKLAVAIEKNVARKLVDITT